MTHAWLDMTRNAGIARIVRMAYRSKTYTWNDIILVKRSMISDLLFFFTHDQSAGCVQTLCCVEPDTNEFVFAPLGHLFSFFSVLCVMMFYTL